MRAWPSPQRLDPRTREELLALLDAPSPQADETSRRIEEISSRRDLPVHSLLLSLLLQTEMSEGEATRHWKSLCAHREELRARMGRDPGARVAALDYFSLHEGYLARPVFVDGLAVERSLSSAWMDGQTALVSHRHFQDQLRRELGRASRRSQDFSLVLMELDDLGRVNSQCGRAAGDVALREVAGILTARLREADVAARVGGARFALILPGTRRSGAYVVAERIRSAVEERFRQPASARERLLLTLSAGLAAYPSDGETREHLLFHASLALESARRDGGNKVILHEAEKPRAFRLRPLGRKLRVEALPRAGGRPAVLKARDMSGSGALLESEFPFEVGEDLDLRFPELAPAPAGSIPARVERLRRTVPGEGGGAYRVGVRFLSEETGQREALENMLARILARGTEQGNP